MMVAKIIYSERKAYQQIPGRPSIVQPDKKPPWFSLNLKQADLDNYMLSFNKYNGIILDIYNKFLKLLLTQSNNEILQLEHLKSKSYCLQNHDNHNIVLHFSVPMYMYVVCLFRYG